MLFPQLRQPFWILALFLVSAGLILAEGSERWIGDGNVFSARINSRGIFVAKGKQPASGLVVNVPSGFARTMLLRPELSFIGESPKQTKARVLRGTPKLSLSAMGNHVANAAKDPVKSPLHLAATVKDDQSRVRIDLPRGYDLVLVELLDRDGVGQRILTQTAAFYLNVAEFIRLRSIGLVRVDLRFFSGSKPQILKAAVLLDSSKAPAILEI
ncbi:MAG: hypothetical protein CSA62_03320 [Planctomycetota bacterium]|nr:MAG: hypothetical protein CSA62_03320 [Planctomycetota bacterium]